MIRRILWIILVGLLGSVPAAAQTSAVEIAKEAKAHYDRGSWKEALELFEQAEAKAHSPVLVLYAARCHRNLGKLVRARTLLRSVVEESLPPDAPAPFIAAREDARTDLQALEPRIAKIVLDRSRAPASWVILVDGDVTTASTVEVDPGSHVVSATDRGEERFRKEVTLEESGAAEVSVVAEKTPAPEPRPEPVDPAPSIDAPSSTAAELAPGLTLIGVGAAALAIGIALRVVAIQTVEDVEDRCVAGSCLRSDEAEIDRAVTFQTVSTVLFIAGGAAAAAGIVLLIVLPEDAPQATVHLQPGGVAIHGTF